MAQIERNRLHEDLTRSIIGCAYDVINELGIGFLESVYENALLVALEQAGLAARSQQPIAVHFRGRPVGEFYADLLVAGPGADRAESGKSHCPGTSGANHQLP